jgi:ribosomal protein S17E
MKKDFKTRIAEIAAKIAENNSDEFKDYFEGYVAELLDKSMPDEVKKVGEAIIKKYPELKKSDISYNMSRDSAGNIDSIKGEIFNGMTMKSFMKFDFKFKDNQMTNLNSAMTIANVNEAYDDNKMELPSGVLTRLNSSISTYADLAMAIEDIIREIIKKEPSMKDLETKSGWNVIFQKLDQLSGKKKADGEDVLDVTSVDKKDAAAIIPGLQEAYNRINRK